MSRPTERSLSAIKVAAGFFFFFFGSVYFGNFSWNISRTRGVCALTYLYTRQDYPANGREKMMALIAHRRRAATEQVATVRFPQREDDTRKLGE